MRFQGNVFSLRPWETPGPEKLHECKLETLLLAVLRGRCCSGNLLESCFFGRARENGLTILREFADLDWTALVWGVLWRKETEFANNFLWLAVELFQAVKSVTYFLTDFFLSWCGFQLDL